MFKPALASAVVAVLAGAPALAEPTSNFEGFHAGIEAGLQRNKAEATAPGDVRLSETDTGYALRGFAGYDWRPAERMVVGGELGLGLGGPTVSGSSGTARLSADPGLTFDASARAGFLATDNALIYGRVGYANASVEVTAENSAADPARFTRDRREGGLLLGAGAEFAVRESLNIRLEYRRADLGDLTSNQVLVGGALRF